MKPLFWIFSGSLLGAISLALGAFGAHGLKSKLGNDLLNTFETATRYQMYHAFAIICLGLIMNSFHSSLFSWSGWFFIIGTILFSGSLYIFVLTGIKSFGAIAPIGGLSLLFGWIFLTIGACNSSNLH